MKKSAFLLYFALIFIGVSISISKAEWVQTNGPYGDNIQALTEIGVNIFAGTKTGVFVTTNNGDSWTAVNNGLASPDVRCFAVSGNNLYTGTYQGVYLSTNYGEAWTKIGQLNFSINHLVLSGGNLYATSMSGVLLSTDFGISWNYINNGLTDVKILSFAVDDSNLFAQTWDGLFCSTDNGQNWNYINASLGRVNSLLITKNNVLAGSSWNLFKSTDKGFSWREISKGITNKRINTLFSTGNYIFVGTNGGGVFFSNDYGEIWTAVNEGLPNIEVNSFALVGNDLFIGTNGNGVWRRPLSEITSVQQLSYNLPMDFSLSQNYPNPINSTTEIKFSIPHSSYVTLKIYNALGQEVETIISEFLSPGEYNTRWDASNCNSGMYYYTLKDEEHSVTRNMLKFK